MSRAHRQTGFILKETIMALALSTTLVVGAAELLVTVAHQRCAASRHFLAVREAGNLMEEFASRPWADLTEERLSAADLSDECRCCLPDAKLHVQLAEDGEDARRIELAISWRRTAASRGEPVRLVGWKFREEERP